MEGLAYAALLCLAPGWLVFFLAGRYRLANSQASTVVLAGNAVRMLFVLSGLLVVRSLRPHLGFYEFLIWLVVFYLATLLLETLLLVRLINQPISTGDRT